MTLDQEIDSLAAKMKKLRAALASVAAQYELLAAQYELLSKQRASAKFGVKPGTKVKSKEGKIGVVKDILHCDFSRPWLLVHVLKKDGSPAANTQTFYNWELAP